MGKPISRIGLANGCVARYVLKSATAGTRLYSYRTIPNVHIQPLVALGNPVLTVESVASAKPLPFFGESANGSRYLPGRCRRVRWACDDPAWMLPGNDVLPSVTISLDRFWPRPTFCLPSDLPKE